MIDTKYKKLPNNKMFDKRINIYQVNTNLLIALIFLFLLIIETIKYSHNDFWHDIRFKYRQNKDNITYKDYEQIFSNKNQNGTETKNDNSKAVPDIVILTDQEVEKIQNSRINHLRNFCQTTFKNFKKDYCAKLRILDDKQQLPIDCGNNPKKKEVRTWWSHRRF